jgi:hypothetical protein
VAEKQVLISARNVEGFIVFGVVLQKFLSSSSQMVELLEEEPSRLKCMPFILALHLYTSQVILNFDELKIFCNTTESHPTHLSSVNFLQHNR